MNTFYHIASTWAALLLLAQLAPASLAQTPSEGAFLSAGIEATGDTAEVRALAAWAEEHEQTDSEQAEQAARRALALARELGDQRGIGESFTILGDLASDLSRKETYYTTAHEVFEQLGDEHNLIRNRVDMGNVYRRRGDIRQALSYYFAALEGFKRFGDIEGHVGVLNNIGITHLEQGNLEEAVTYYRQAAILAETLDEHVPLVWTLINLGGTLAEHGSYESAEATLRRALTIAEDRGDRNSIARTSNNLGFLFNKQGRYRQALPFLLRAERLGSELKNEDLLFSVTDELGKAYTGLGQYDRALYYANEGLVLAQVTGSVFDQMAIHQTLTGIYDEIGDYEQALAHHRQYAAVRDSFLNARNTEIIAEMQTRYESEEKQRDNERLEQENRIQALQLTLLFGAVVIALLVAGLFYYRYRVKRKANHLLEELDTAKSRFFANISHEFRTPLTLLRGPLENLGKGVSPSRETAGAMLRNTRRMEKLVDEMLDLNRLEVGKLALQLAPGDLVGSLRRIVQASTPLAERNGIDLTFEHDIEHCPRLYDPEKLEKIVGNLLSNALKFTPKGGSVCVSLNCLPATAQGGGEEIEILVSDDGPGIPAEMQESVFERFEQIEDGAFQGGTGIGLALARELAELHGGTIRLESEPGAGSTFAVWLPLEEVALEEATEEPQQRRTGPVPAEENSVDGDGTALSEKPVVAKAEEAESDLSRRGHAEPDHTTVLIIEDNDDVRAYLRRLLEESYRVLEAAAGEAGLQQAREALPDLIVSDVMLPGIDGYEVARKLKAMPETECIPVVALTARAAEEDRTEGYGSGVEVYITKPFSPETLRAAVARLLEERRRLRRRLWKEARETGEKGQKNGYPSLHDRARAVVRENLYDEDFGVKELASALNVTRQTLYNRFKSEVDVSPSDFIRTLRLERAHELLSGEAGSVSEVAYAVGFKSMSHFTRSFRGYYGVLPSSVLRMQVDETGH